MELKAGDKIIMLDPCEDQTFETNEILTYLRPCSPGHYARNEFGQEVYIAMHDKFELVNSLEKSVEEISGVCSIATGKITGPRITTSENLCYFDVDETLINWSEQGTRSADFYGTKKRFWSHTNHIEFLKSLKKRGYYIIVHSGNGWRWAKNVIEALELNDFVDEIKSKPSKVIDDKEYSNWMPSRIFLD